QALQGAVLAAAAVAVEDVEDAVEAAGLQLPHQRGDAVHRVRVHATRAQRLEHVAAGVERDLALGAGPAHQHGHAPEHGGVAGAQRRQRAHAPPPKPLAASAWATWPMSPAPITSSRSPSSRMSGNTPASSPAALTTTGSIRPRVRIARASERASAPAIGASPAG